MKIYFSLLFTLFFSQSIFANDLKYKAINFPAEFELILETLQVDNPKFFEEVTESIKEIDKYAQFMRKEDILQIAKLEIYKTILSSQKSDNKQIDKNALTLLDHHIKFTNKPILKWFLNALKSDVSLILDHKEFHNYNIQINNNLKLEKIDHRRLERKIQLINGWVQILKINEPDSLQLLYNQLTPHLRESIKQINIAFKTLFLQKDPQSLNEKASKELIFFKVEDLKQKPIAPVAEPPKAKSVEEIVAPVINETPVELPVPSNEDWLNQ